MRIKLFENFDLFENNTYRLVVDLDERGEYAATVYDDKDKEIWDCDTQVVSELIEDGFLKSKPNEDLAGLENYLSSHNIIPKDSKITVEE